MPTISWPAGTRLSSPGMSPGVGLRFTAPGSIAGTDVATSSSATGAGASWALAMGPGVRLATKANTTATTQLRCSARAPCGFRREGAPLGRNEGKWTMARPPQVVRRRLCWWSVDVQGGT